MPRFLTEYDRAQAQGMLWTPAEIGPHNWYDASQLGSFSLTSGNEITQWNDLGSRGENLTPLAGQTRATLELSNRHGVPAVFYPNNNSSLATSTARAYTDLTVFAAFFNPQQNTNGGFDSNQRVYHQADTGSYIVMAFGPPDSDYVGRVGSNPETRVSFRNLTDPHIATLFADSATGTGTLTSDGGFASGSFTPSAGSSSVFGVGSSATANNRSLQNGRIFELVLAERACTRRERWLVEGYLSWKWGIRLAADHPFANRPPLIGD